MSDWKESGHRLKFYAEEQEAFPEQYGRKINNVEARIVSDKLKRHFKIGSFSLRFTDRVGGGSCSYGGLIKVRWQTSIGIICHELAHLHGYRKYGIRGHNKKMLRVMARLMNYCKKKGYWASELTQRTAPKVVKELTKDEQKALKVKHTEDKINRYESKLRMYTKKLQRARRSLMMLQRVKCSC